MKCSCHSRGNAAASIIALVVLTLVHVRVACGQATSERPWFQRSIVGMEVGPTGAQFGYSDPKDTRYCRVWSGRDIVRHCVAANAEYLVLWAARR